ncbi:MAG: phosphoribosyl-AMP cyclohydrolase [Desulfobacteraceae bacterium]|jgi:phosphoribosyl-AMP cyclohydrolase|nr:phosphoribosyl-AMP cyclohydrolase [Desulfobacteraceae bacterium]
MVEPDFDKCGGLVPAIAQDTQTGDVLMMAYMNRKAWQATVATGQATYWSRSRSALWVKGQSSGNLQKVHEIWLDCDNDTILLKVTQIGGAACHTGHRSCFYRRLDGDRLTVVGEPLFNPQEVYGK